MRIEGRTVYYSDELNDDMQVTKTNQNVNVNTEYEYVNQKLFGKIFSAILYYGVAIPILAITSRLIHGVRVKGKKNIKKLKNAGYVMYCNHTHFVDAYLAPVRIAAPKRTYIIASKDAVEIRGLANVVKALGALPLPDTSAGLLKLSRTVKQLLNDKKAIMIYPEAHIWYFYTGLRNFPSTSFKFPAASGVPAVPIAVTYKKRNGLFHERKPRMIVHIGEAIFPKEELSARENAEYFCLQVKDYMEKIIFSKENYAYYNYVNENEEVAETHES